MTWVPGEPMEIKNKLIAEGGWIERTGITVFNLYRPPTIVGAPGDAKVCQQVTNRLRNHQQYHARPEQGRATLQARRVQSKGKCT